MEQKSIVTHLWLSFGKSAFDKIFTFSLFVVAVASGVGVKLLDQGTAQLVLAFIAILGFSALAVILYFNHKLVDLFHQIAEIKDSGRNLAGAFTDLRTKQAADLRSNTDEIMKYFQLLGLMNHYRLHQEDSNWMRIDKEERMSQYMQNEMKQIEGWLLENDPGLSPKSIRSMMDVFYDLSPKDTKKVLA